MIYKRRRAGLVYVKKQVPAPAVRAPGQKKKNPAHDSTPPRQQRSGADLKIAKSVNSTQSIPAPCKHTITQETHKRHPHTQEIQNGVGWFVLVFGLLAWVSGCGWLAWLVALLCNWLVGWLLACLLGWFVLVFLFADLEWLCKIVVGWLVCICFGFAGWACWSWLPCFGVLVGW